jgi:ribonuclease T2
MHSCALAGQDIFVYIHAGFGLMLRCYNPAQSPIHFTSNDKPMSNMNKPSTKTILAVVVAIGYAAFSYFSGGNVAPQHEAKQQQQHQQQQQHPQRQQEQKQSVAGDFAYYVLALSWSPSFCATQSAEAQPEQCGVGRRFSFVVHGLWPQFDKGWPEACATQFPARVPEDLIKNTLDIMPSHKLIGHEWEKHGVCSGLDQAAYFNAARHAKDSINIPAQFVGPKEYISTTPDALKQAFLDANKQLNENMIAVTCKDRNLQEVRICMDKNLAPRACGANERRQCKSEQLVLPPMRGG